MRTAPAVQLDTETGVGWRVALWAALLMATAASAGWALAVGTAAVWAVAALVFTHAAALAWASRKPRRARLAWDGAGWTLLEAGQAEARHGEVAVALDLGGALLLRFVPTAGPRRHARWLALQRKPSMPWHALRCALYSPRPVPAGEAA